MDPRLAVRGIVIGLALAAPVGPVSVLVIRRSLERGARSGLATGLGAALADAVFALVGTLGLAGAPGSLGHHAVWLRAGGGVFLCALGVRAFGARAAPSRARTSRGARHEAPSPRGYVGQALGTLVFTLVSPMSIVSFAAAAAGLGARGGSAAASLVAGVFAGSALWWALLAGGVAALRRRLPAGALRWLDRASGAALVVLGAAMLLSPP